MKRLLVLLSLVPLLGGCVVIYMNSQNYSNNTEPAGLSSNVDDHASQEVPE